MSCHKVNMYVATSLKYSFAPQPASTLATMVADLKKILSACAKEYADCAFCKGEYDHKVSRLVVSGDGPERFRIQWVSIVVHSETNPMAELGEGV